MNSRITYLKGFLRSFIYPDRCALCGNVVPHKTELCHECFRDEKLIDLPVCMSCGRSEKKCNCKGRSVFYQGITAPYEYSGKARRGIMLWKYKRYYRAEAFFAKRLKACIERDFDLSLIDVITFVPQTVRESAEKYFNQGQVLAEELGRQIDIPVEVLLVKINETQRQHHIPFYLKSGNVFGVFECADESAVNGRTILLVDDIKTSGCTLNECAKMLHLGGAATVYCAVIAVT